MTITQNHRDGTALDPPASDRADLSAALMEHVLFEVKRLIAGQDHLIERLLVALLARGHVLLEGVPGLAKTVTVKSLAQVVGGSFGRIQFTPDLVPSDLTGTRIYNGPAGEFTTELGPIFANLVLADEINRAPAKVQSALLEVMQERQVTIGPTTYRVPDPFLVLATQNPIESEGTYPLPEAQVDRFMMKVLVDYPSPDEETVVVQRSLDAPATVDRSLTIDDLHAFQRAAADVYVDPRVVGYAVGLTTATRDLGRWGLSETAPYVAFGASPRGSIGLVHAARALALLRGRGYVLPHDVRQLAPDVLRHRLVLTYQALAEEVTADRILDAVLGAVPMPRLELAREASA